MTDLVRCGLSFNDATEFRAAFVRRGGGRCFVPYPDELGEGQVVIVDARLGDSVHLEVSGVVLQPDFDEGGNIGVLVQLDEASAAAVTALDEKLDAPATAPIEVSATQRVRRTGKIAVTTPGAAEAPPGAEGAPELLEPGTTVDERFAIEAHVASGGMGDVYRANHVHLKRAVALKLMRRELANDPEMWARFKREAELVSQLESPHVVRVFDFGQTKDGQPYLAMEYVEGPTLDSLVEKGPLDPSHATRLLTQVCAGLAEAHALGVIHRDLKPANIIVGRKRDGAEVAKILDFGIARLADRGAREGAQKLTQVGIVVGTPAYLAPEQALAEDLDQRTDVYALGCVAYELLTGQPPFRAAELRKVISLHLTAAPEDPARERPELAKFPALCAAVLKALAKEKERRFQSVADFGRALEEALDGRAPTEPPPRAPSPEWQEAPAAAPMSPDDWPPPSEASPAPAAATPVDLAAADDFFTTVGGRPLTGANAPLGLRAANPLDGIAEPDTLRALQAARDRLPPTPSRGVAMLVEVLGPAPGSPLAKACLGRALAVAARAGAFIDVADEDGAGLGFVAGDPPPAGRAMKTLVAMQEAVADEGQRAQPPAKASLRAVALFADFDPDVTPLCGPARARARQLAARLKAGDLACDKALAGAARDAVDTTASAQPELALVTARRLRTRRSATELIGRGPVLDLLERRLVSLTQGVVAPVLVRGASGAGRSALAHEVATRARTRSLVSVVAHALSGAGDEPFGALASVLCATCGVPWEHRAARLRGALAPLGLSPHDVEAALVLAGVTQLPAPLTAGQAVAALRSVLNAGAARRPVVLVFDGLEAMDAQSVEAFRELVSRPAARELTIGLGDDSVVERCGAVASIEVPPLTPTEMNRLAHAALDAAPGPRLQALLADQAHGLPGLVLDWLWWLDDRGSLEVTGTSIELVDVAPELSPAQLLAERVAALPLDVQRVLEAAALGGETFDGPQLSTAWPRATPAAFQQAVASRLVRPSGQRRWRFTSPVGRNAVLATASPERRDMHLRLAAALIEQGRADSASVDVAEVGRHLALGGDGARGAQLWKHAADAALARRVPREAVRALRGLASALALLPASPDSTRARVDTLARAAGIALSAQDAVQARALVDDAAALERLLPSPSPELALSLARVHRSEARRARAAEALTRAAQLAKGTPLAALVDTERAESREQEGDLDEAARAFEAALSGAEAARELARWHGEVDLPARLLARLAAVRLQKRDVETARRLLDQSLTRWRATGWAPGEARVLSNLGATLAAAKQFEPAARAYEAAAEAAGRSGDLLFRARSLLQQARALKRHDASAAKPVVAEARKLCTALGWDQGRAEAAALG